MQSFCQHYKQHSSNGIEDGSTYSYLAAIDQWSSTRSPPYGIMRPAGVFSNTKFLNKITVDIYKLVKEKQYQVQESH
jgi:hypothetical protein